MADPHGQTKLKIESLTLPQTAGKTFYVNNSGVGINLATASNNNTGEDPAFPLSTIAGALDKCTASRGDTIVVMPGHAETLTAQLDFDVAGVSVIGLGQGNLRPTLTVNGTIDLIDVSAANMRLENFILTIATTDAATALVNIDAAGFTLKDVYMIPSATSVNVVDCISITANGDDCLIEGLEILNKTVAVTSFVHFEGAASNVTLRNCWMFGDTATGGLIDSAKVDYLMLENVHVATVGTTQPAATLGSNPEGMAVNCSFAGTSTTLADNGALGNLMRSFNVRVLEETDNSAQGALIPAVDAE